MGRRILIWLLMALTLSVGVACRGVELPAESSVIVTFTTGEPLTRSVSAAAADGREIVGSGLFIAIANYSGKIVAVYKGVDVPNEIEKLTPSSASQVSIKFKTIESAGDYTVYAVANSAGLWDLKDGSDDAELDDFDVDVGATTSAPRLNGLEFAELATDTPILDEEDPMPLSAKGTLSVNESLNGQVELELLRCVAKIGFKFKNETGSLLTLNNCNVTIHDINPSQGYLFPQENDATGTPGSLNLITSTTIVDIDEATELYGNILVFPSVAPVQTVGSRYYCDISFTVNEVSKSFTNLPLHDRLSRDIPSLGRNQYLQIETRINTGLDVSFNFEVQDWNEKTESIIFH